MKKIEELKKRRKELTEILQAKKTLVKVKNGITIREGSKNMEYLRKHLKAIEELQQHLYEDATYDENLKVTNLKDGYQVSFYQENKTYTSKQYDKLVEQFLKASADKTVYFGKFGGTPEISFNIKDLKVAIELAKENNQISIWSWEINDEIKTGGSGRKENNMNLFIDEMTANEWNEENEYNYMTTIEELQKYVK